MSNRIYSTGRALPIRRRDNGIEQELFAKVIANTNPTLDEESYSQDVVLARRLLKFLVDAQETPIIRAEKISWLTNRAVYIKSEDHLLPGGSAKGRAVFGIVLQNIREYVAAHPNELAAISAQDNPLQELLSRTFDNTTIVANSAGNHGISVAAVFNQLKKDYGINTNVVVYVPETSPTFKQQRILAEGAEVIQYDTKADREVLLRAHIAKTIEGGGKALAYSTEPNKVIHGGFAGLGTEGAEIAEWLGKGDRVNSLAPITNWEVRSPTSSGPTFGTLLKFFGPDSIRIIATQDIRNGAFASEILQTAEKGEVELSAEQLAKLTALKNQIRTDGAPENGLSTKKINSLTKEQIIRNGKLELDPNNLRLVPEAAMKLGAALIFIESKAIKNLGAILPEKAGAVAVASIILEAINEPHFIPRLGEIISRSGLDYNKFLEIAGLSEEEITELGLEDLKNKVTFNVFSFFRAQRLPSGDNASPVIAIVSGANRDQVLELELRKFVALDSNDERHFVQSAEFLRAFREAHPKTIYEILSRTETRTVNDNDGNPVVYASGEDLKTAVDSALGSRERSRIFEGISPSLGINESLGWIAKIQKQVTGLLVSQLAAAEEFGISTSGSFASL